MGAVYIVGIPGKFCKEGFEGLAFGEEQPVARTLMEQEIQERCGSAIIVVTSIWLHSNLPTWFSDVARGGPLDGPVGAHYADLLLSSAPVFCGRGSNGIWRLLFLMVGYD